VLVSEWSKEFPFEVESARICGRDFTIVFDDALVGGLDEELDELPENLSASERVAALPPRR